MTQPFIPTDFYKVLFHSSGSAGYGVETGLGLSFPDATGFAEVQDTILDIANAMALVVSEDYSFASYDVVMGADAGPPYIRLGVALDSVSGAVSGAAAQPSSALRVDLHTTTPGRTGTGHFYLPPPGDGDIENDGGLSSSQNGRMDDLVTALMTTIPGDHLNGYTVFHPTNASVTTPSGVEVMSPYRRISTQVRRRNRRL